MFAQLQRVVPAAVNELPSAALGTESGAGFRLDPKDSKGLKALQRVFLVDLVVADDAHVINAGGRVHVRFSHEPLIYLNKAYDIFGNLFLLVQFLRRR